MVNQIEIFFLPWIGYMKSIFGSSVACLGIGMTNTKASIMIVLKYAFSLSLPVT